MPPTITTMETHFSAMLDQFLRIMDLETPVPNGDGLTAPSDDFYNDFPPFIAKSTPSRMRKITGGFDRRRMRRKKPHLLRGHAD